MRRHIVSRSERNILSALRRFNKDAPEEVLAAEARQRLRALVLHANEHGETQPVIAARLTYSVSQVERLIRVAKEERRDGEPSPLLMWKWRAKAMEPAPAPEEAFTPKVRSIGFEVKSEPEPTVAELKARIAALTDAREDDADDTNDDGPRPVYAVTPHTHYRVHGSEEVIVVDDMPWLRPGAQVSFITGGMFGVQAHRRTVLSIQRMHRTRCLSLQVGESDRT